jgi:enoyl-[acyl-carrier protein] reductase III
MNVNNKNALVTGGTRGIGRAVVMRLAEDGFRNIFANYLQNEQEAENTKTLVESLGASCHLLKANLAQLDAVDELFSCLEKSCNELDTFVHCAALNNFKPTIQVRPNQWDLVLNINTRSFLYCVQKCVPLMSNGGSIIALSSLGSHKVIPNYGVMGPAKAALESLVKNLEAELAGENIRVNAVCGGIIETDSLNHFPDKDQWLKNAIGRTPAGRIGKPEDISAAVSFLCSTFASYIIGQVIIVDGGLSLF